MTLEWLMIEDFIAVPLAFRDQPRIKRHH